MAPLTATPARGVLAIARAVLAQQPDIPLDELATKLATSLGARRADVRQVLIESELFPAPTEVPGVSPPAREITLPRYVAINGIGRHAGVGIYDTTLLDAFDAPRRILHPVPLTLVDAIVDGLNLGLDIPHAWDRATTVEQLVCGAGEVVRVPQLAPDSAFVCDLKNQTRAWGPFPSAADADAFRNAHPALQLWAVTMPWPRSRFYPPAAYDLFDLEAATTRPAPISADDMTPVILAAARDYLAYQSESNRMAGPCRDAYQRLLKLLLAGAAPVTREKLYVNHLEEQRAWGPFASQVDAQCFLDSDPKLRRAAVELGDEPRGTELLPPAAYYGRWPLWEGLS